jgi:cellulose synthase/poly-beta-1,6-N-acetylglucosamine synthase-like glycosyltransferase
MWIVFSITIAYLIVIGIITFGWFGLPKNPLNKFPEKEIFVSIVIAVRNESSNIQKLLKQIVNQNYNSNFLEVIFCVLDFVNFLIKLLRYHLFQVAQLHFSIICSNQCCLLVDSR